MTLRKRRLWSHSTLHGLFGALIATDLVELLDEHSGQTLTKEQIS